ncbi:MAG TPA: DUF4349 domain-containing protein [Longimicrobiaceae bacterium]|jgi:hypothetical protein|nr:DUF4349 domain-containing protein [Longimicrobiaceae bacterium]
MRGAPVVAAAILLSAACSGRDSMSANREAGDAAAAPASSAAAPASGMESAITTSDTVGAVAAPAADGSVGSAGVSGAGSAALPSLATQMLIRTGTAQIQVDSLQLGIDGVRRLVEREGGVVAGSSMTAGRQEAAQATMELKVPAERFEAVVAGLASLGKLESVNTTSQDVGEEYVDIGARVVNARRLEARIAALLDTHAGKLADVVEVEHELARVREEIERYEGRLRYLRSRSAVSTLTVNLHEPRPVVGEYPGDSPIGAAFKRSWQNFVGFMAGLVSVLGFLLPLGMVAAVTWVAARAVGRRIRRSARPASPPPPPAREEREPVEIG